MDTDTDTQKTESETETEIGMMLLQAKESRHQKLEMRKDSFLGP